MGQYKKLWYMLIGVLAVTFTLLGYLGVEVYRQSPPFPEKFVSADGKVLLTKDDIGKAQAAWSWVRCWGTVHTKPPTGRPIGYTANWKHGWI